ncbi:gamma-glutamyl-gamma-aminobutyrate hydrolase family protein [Bacillus timonensis]|nr:gamma-glutamyl-gamma-aminobutyrate hydrolase family protein [Bacillus timonensis]
MDLNIQYDVIVLEADGTVDSFGNGYAYQIKNGFEIHEYQPLVLSLKEYAYRLHELPKKPIVISGGMTEVTSTQSWIIEVKKYFKSLLERNMSSSIEERIPVLGICFGAQLLAECNHEGSVTYLKPPEMGISEITLTKQHPLFSGLEENFLAFSFHYNQINTNQVSILSSNQKNNRSFVQAFEIPNTGCYGVQFHPELTSPAFRNLIKQYQQLLEEDLNVKLEEIEAGLKNRDCDNTVIFKNFMNIHR